jgi:hypothetical protein
MVRHAAVLLLLLSLQLFSLLNLLLPPQRRLEPKQCRLDLCAMHCNKKHCNAKNSLNASTKCSNTDTDPRSENNVNIVCDVAYDKI